MAVERALVKVDLINNEEGIIVSSERAQFSSYRLILNQKPGTLFPILPHQTHVDIVAYFEDGIQLMWGEVSLSLPDRINVEVTSRSGEKQERRKNLKVRASFDAKVRAMWSMGRRKVRVRLGADIHVRDISMGGLGFFSDSRFFRNQRIELDLSYLKPGFKVEFQILRKEKNLNYSGFPLGFKYRYGGKFLKLRAEEERLVCEYVFRIQLQDYQRRKRKNN